MAHWLSRNLTKLGIGDWMTANIPSVDSADNNHMADVIGNKNDTHYGNSIAARLNTLEKHIHSASKVYQTMKDGVTVTSNPDAWTLGSSRIIVGSSHSPGGDVVDLGGDPNVVRIPCGGHGFVVGNFVKLIDTVNYNGTFKIVAISDTNHFDIESAYVPETLQGYETVTDVIPLDFDIHHLSIENLSANGVYEIVIYASEIYGEGTEVGRVRFTKNATQDGILNIPFQTPIIAAQGEIKVKIATSNAAQQDDATVSICYHTH